MVGLGAEGKVWGTGDKDDDVDSDDGEDVDDDDGDDGVDNNNDDDNDDAKVSGKCARVPAGPGNQKHDMTLQR